LGFITARGGIPPTNYYNKVAGELGIYELRSFEFRNNKFDFYILIFYFE